MKRRDALEAIRKAFRKLTSSGSESGSIRVDFVTGTDSSHPRPASRQRDPDFEFDGWRFYAKTGFWDDEPTEAGDASVTSPDGTIFGLVWDAGAPLHYKLDFTNSFGPMLYVRIPSPVRDWGELRQHLLQLVPAMNRELTSRERE